MSDWAMCILLGLLCSTVFLYFNYLCLFKCCYLGVLKSQRASKNQIRTNMNFALTNIIPLYHSSMNQFMLKKYITAEMTVKGGLGNNITHCHGVNTKRNYQYLRIILCFSVTNVACFQVHYLAYRLKEHLLNFIYWSLTYQSLPSVRFLTEPTHFNSYIQTYNLLYITAIYPKEAKENLLRKALERGKRKGTDSNRYVISQPGRVLWRTSYKGRK